MNTIQKLLQEIREAKEGNWEKLSATTVGRLTKAHHLTGAKELRSILNVVEKDVAVYNLRYASGALWNALWAACGQFLKEGQDLEEATRSAIAEGIRTIGQESTPAESSAVRDRLDEVEQVDARGVLLTSFFGAIEKQWRHYQRCREALERALQAEPSPPPSAPSEID